MSWIEDILGIRDISDSKAAYSKALEGILAEKQGSSNSVGGSVEPALTRLYPEGMGVPAEPYFVDNPPSGAVAGSVMPMAPRILNSLNGESSIDELHDALQVLAGVGLGSNLSVGGSVATSLVSAAADAARVAAIIGRANGNLGSAWYNVRTVAEEINRKVEILMQNYVEELKKFIEQTRSNEQAIEDAVTRANAIAESVLSRLGSH